MKPVCILSSNDNPEYLFCLPIVAKSWQLQGFDVRIILQCSSQEKYIQIIHFVVRYCRLATIYNALLHDDTINRIQSPNKNLYIQCCRLYATNSLSFHNDEYCILGDADMFIASDFLSCYFNRVNVFGHDLTGYQEIPMCYVGMTAQKWLEVMGTDGMEKDLENFSKHKSYTWHESWGADQQILTAKLKAYGFENINFMTRGIDPNNLNLPLGRWDRYGGFKKPSGIIHDVHLPRAPYSDEWFPKIEAMCNEIYPHVDWEWLKDYRDEFMKEMKIT